MTNTAYGQDGLSLLEAERLLAPYLEGNLEDAPAILAVSGGPDSSTLLRFAGQLKHRSSLKPILVAIVDHGLRPESQSEAKRVVGWACECGFEAAILSWVGEKPKAGVQEAARQARYQLLTTYAAQHGADIILTGHTLDDQAETVLMRLMHGSGPRGLRGMAGLSLLDGGIRLARPWLSLSKTQLLAACRREGWPYLEDSSNVNERFARARLRRIAPLLEAEGFTARRLATLAQRMARVEEAVDKQAEHVFARVQKRKADDCLVLDGGLLTQETPEIVVRVFEKALLSLPQAHAPVALEALERLVEKALLGLAGKTRFTANLAGILVKATADGQICFKPEPSRRSNMVIRATEAGKNR